MFVSEIFDECSEILGTTDQARIFRKISQAVKALMESGAWFHTIQDVDVCTGWDGFTVTLPRDIEVPLAINIDGSPTYFRSRLFQYHINKGGEFATVGWAWDDRGFVATQMDIRQPAQLIAVAEMANDAGKTIRIIGNDSNGRALRSQQLDGTGVDGLILPIHSLSDYQQGILCPDNATVKTRTAIITPINQFASVANKLAEGARAVLSLVSGSMPSPLVAGNTYYVNSPDADTIQIYLDRVSSQGSQYPIALVGFASGTVLLLTDSRISQAVTAVLMASTPTITIDLANEVTFNGAILPSPLQPGVTYFSRSLSPTELQIYTSIADAQAETNPVYLTGTGTAWNVNLRKAIAPQTQLQFTYPHYFSTGDLVQASTNGGSLPNPLISGQNYYVYVVDAKTISIHLTNADALAHVNPIVLTSAGTGSNLIFKLIPATFVLGTTSNINAPNHGLQPATGSGATATATVTGPVTNLILGAPGSAYSGTPTVSISTGSGAAAHSVLTLDKVTSFVVDTAGAGYPIAPLVSFTGGGGGSGATAHAVLTGNIVTSIVVDTQGTGYTIAPGVVFTLASQGAGATAHAIVVANVVYALVIDFPGSGYDIAPIVLISGGGGSGATGTAVITTSFVTGIKVTAGGTLYVYPPAVSITGGGGSGATGTAVVVSGAVTAINIVTEGTGYTSTPAVSMAASTGAFIQFSTTGTFPAAQTINNTTIPPTITTTPIAQGVSYLAEGPMTSDTFTIQNTDFSTLNIMSLGSGSQFLVISRSFTPVFTNIWTGDFNGLTTGNGFYFGTDYLLPITSPAIDTATEFYMRVITPTTAQVYDTSAHALALASVTGKIQVTSFGVGQSYYAIRVGASIEMFSNSIQPASIGFLNNGTTVQFSSTGTLPAPLTSATDYTVQIVGSSVQIYDSTNTLVTLTTPGIGILTMAIIRQITPIPSVSVTQPNSQINTGDSLSVRPDTDILPVPLVAATDYFARRLTHSSYSLFDTVEHAKDTGSTGLISFTSVGATVVSDFFVDLIAAEILVKSVAHVEKPVTEGFVSLYAWDYGRANDLALIGQYHPDETNPMYRRIRIGKASAWVRMAYRVKAPKVSSTFDYLPIEQERAVTMAVHAIDLEDKDFGQQASAYWALALGYLKSQQSGMDDHAMKPIQVSNLVFGDRTDPVMS